MTTPLPPDPHDPTATSLRDRKKAIRHDAILSHAKTLFTERGIDATTMADIADAADVSPPTVFNYFGNKDGILIALITEGTRNAFAHDVAMTPRVDTDFATILTDTLSSVSRGTLNIAGKRVWRYSEAAAIRHPNTELAREYARVDAHLRDALKTFVGCYDFTLRSADPADTDFLAELIFDIWNAAFFELIKDDALDLDTHDAHLSARLRPLVRLLFDDAFVANPVLKTKEG
ncbi:MULTISPECIES: TetR/AcrR family transcriptional regulator [Roseobacteraceae]|jgi:AcrR family transcriptional regulator|uniref:HTH-type transcriptional repressor Bm3R1 n=1 Tax=Pseudosulfitobacter pseudonitzschiae TaxID=1402135 RepID=A0A221JYJ4_9RHOB|nr:MULTISPECIES: TetR/AcrR family transcriptional regulator [Roseobacteraceae]ASM71723.1 HTH-type transcriptional repressor Bm3R1 [Pseudosulfitobacter pseudonitzschiae]